MGGSEGMFVDHVILGVVDIEAAAARLRDEHGLGCVPGGRHLGGTTNLIVPLAPPLFLELLGVGDPSLADGAWLAQTLAGRDRVLWWALGVDDIEESARRRGIPVQSGEMAMADGSTHTFRVAGMHRYPLPFFCVHDAPPGERERVGRERYAAAGHACAPRGYAFVEVGGPAEFLDGWLGDHGLPVRHVDGPPGIRGVGIDTADGEIVLR